MDPSVEHEICANCKKEIPHYNYVMHTAHCARNFSLCQVCKEPVPKNQMENHRKKHTTNVRAAVEEKLDFPKQVPRAGQAAAAEPPRARPRTQNGFNFNEPSSSYNLGRPLYGAQYNRSQEYNFPKQSPNQGAPKIGTEKKQKSSPPVETTTLKPKPTSLLACKYCDLELPKLDLQEHEDYCGARTDKCNECGEIVMFKYRKLHEETNHGFLKLNDEPGPRPTWDSDTQRPVEPSYMRGRQRPAPIYTVNSFDFSPLYSSYNNYSSSSLASEGNGGEKKETYRDISRRLDCKTEYIRNLLHDSASITVPLRRNGITPRNHFNHNKGPAPQPPQRRPNPPTELLIPCEFCHTPIPHEELIQHETGCRPDLARFNPRRRSPSPDDYFVPPTPSSPEVELPCEFCADMFPASELLRHQLTCS